MVLNREGNVLMLLFYALPVSNYSKVTRRSPALLAIHAHGESVLLKAPTERDDIRV